MRYFSKKRFTMRQVVGLLVIVFLGIAAIAYAVSIPNTFSQGQTISSGAVNQNFQALADAINTGDVTCPSSMVRSGSVCIDKYEASVWQTTNAGLIAKIKAGTATLAELQANAIQRGATTDDYGSNCPDTGNGCKDYYAVSVAGVTPSRYITWFQAAAAARNSNKRLPTNQEWQVAALGTPDTGTDNGTTDCAVNSANLINTGSRSGCVSDVGANDMVGNVWEWVADWMQGNGTAGNNWAPSTGNAGTGYGSDWMYGTNPAQNQGTNSTNMPAAIIRGGDLSNGTLAGVFALLASNAPSISGGSLGFRCAH